MEKMADKIYGSIINYEVINGEHILSFSNGKQMHIKNDDGIFYLLNEDGSIREEMIPKTSITAEIDHDYLDIMVDNGKINIRRRSDNNNDVYQFFYDENGSIENIYAYKSINNIQVGEYYFDANLQMLYKKEYHYDRFSSVFTPNRLNSIERTYPSGLKGICRYQYTDNGIKCTNTFYINDKSVIDFSSDMINAELSGDKIVFTDENNRKFLSIDRSGTRRYIISDDESLVLYPDGSFFNTKTNNSGNYVINEDGSYIRFIDSNENVNVFDETGRLIGKMENDSNTAFLYDYKLNSERKIQNFLGYPFKSFPRYAMINHIEYDEESYDILMHNLLEIFKNNESSMKEIDNAINESINSFKDKYDKTKYQTLKSDIFRDINKIYKLEKIINFSLLGYLTCDNELMDMANKLVDDLFEGTSNLARYFINNIKNTIEDRNNDGIVEYKIDTDFYEVYNNFIPACEYVDNKGNTWYFNNENNLIGAKGEDLKIEYGGELFSVSFDEKNGNAILKDSNNQPLDIFGEYNIESSQYGGNQMVFLSQSYEMLENDYIVKKLDEYFPNSTIEERANFLNHIAGSCGYYAFTNTIFKEFEGRESEFFEKMGYPMYSIKGGKNGIEKVDYNYEVLALDLICHINYGKDFEREYSRREYLLSKNTGTYNLTNNKYRGTMLLDYIEMSKYMKEQYGIDIKVYDTVSGGNIERLFSEDNDKWIIPDIVKSEEKSAGKYIMVSALDKWIVEQNGEERVFDGGHAMYYLGTDDNGNIIVSSWGERYILKPDNGKIKFTTIEFGR